jgi:hypothetical protein
MPSVRLLRVVFDMRLSRFTLLATLLLVTPTAYAQRRRASIRSIDFKNFTYLLPADLRTPGGARTITVKDGRFPGTDNDVEMYFGKVEYGDVTGDGAEEALVYLGVHTGGSAMPGVAYVYTLRSRRPSLLWFFSTGDRADGGLHRLYAENGNLVVELYGPQKRWEGDGQLMRFTRKRYVWFGNRFRQQGRKEVIPLSAPSNNGMQRSADTHLVMLRRRLGAPADAGR